MIALPAAPRQLVVDPATTALVVVDLINDFCHPDGWLASWGVDVGVTAPVVDAVRELAPLARAAGMPVIWVDWGVRPDLADMPPSVLRGFDPDGEGRGIGSVLPNGSRALTAGSWGVEPAAGLERQPDDLEVAKVRMTGFHDTPLDSILRELGIETLLLAGVNSDQCVAATLMDAAAIGYDVVLVDGATGTTSPAYCHEATLYNVRQCYGFTVEVRDLVAALT